MVRASSASIDYLKKYDAENHLNYPNLAARLSAYYTALANEKKSLIKLSDFINGSGLLK